MNAARTPSGPVDANPEPDERQARGGAPTARTREADTDADAHIDADTNTGDASADTDNAVIAEVISPEGAHVFPDLHEAHEPVPTAQADPRAPAQNLTSRTVEGVAWLGIIALLSKLISMVQQVVLGRLLTDEDFGAYSVALGAASFLMLVQTVGLVDVLTQKPAELARRANAGFWLGSMISLVTLLGVVALAWPISLAFRSEDAQWLMYILAIKVVFDGLSILPLATVRVQLRFKTLALVNFLNQVASAAISIPLAYATRSAYALVIPLVAVSAVQFVVLWVQARPRISLRLDRSQWPELMHGSWKLVGFGLIGNLSSQGDKLTLAAIAGEKAAGVYFYAFNLAVKAIQLFADALNQTLFPILSTIGDDPKRQLSSFMRASRALLMVGAPACILQAVTAEPLIRLLLGPTWDHLVPLFQTMSLSMPFVLLGAPQVSLLKAQGRSRRLLIWSLVYAPSCIGAVALGAVLNGALGASVALAIYIICLGPTGTWISIRPSGGRFTDVLGLFLPASLAALAAGVPAYYSVQLLPEGWSHPLIQIAMMSLVMGAVYLPLARMVDAPTFRETQGLVLRMLSNITARFRRSSPSSSSP